MKNSKFKEITEEVTTDEINMRKLAKGRINALLIDPLFAKPLLKKLNIINEVEKSHFSVTSGTIHVMFSKKSVKPEIVKLFNKGLEKLKNNGKLKEIIETYTAE